MTNTYTPQSSSFLDEVSAFVRRFVFLKDESLYRLIATWIIGTYLHHDLEWYGYLFVHSPESQSGKTTLLDVIESLVYKPQLMIEPTPAVLFRTGTDRTQLLDEVDSWANGTEMLRSVLNAGFKRGGSVPRMRKQEDWTYVVDDISIYCPRVLAGIGTGILNAVTRSRTFMIQLMRQTKGERRERFRGVARQSANPLREKIEQWAEQNREAVMESYAKAEFPYLSDFNDRTIDISDALAAITEVMHRDDIHALGQARIELVAAIALSRSEKDVSEAQQIIAGLCQAANDCPGTLKGSATELAAILSGKGHKFGELQVSAALQRYGFQNRSARINGGSPRKVYTLEPEALRDVMERYGNRSPVVGEMAEAA